MFHLDPVSWFSGVDPHLATFFLSMLPITELRATVPIALQLYGLDVYTTWIVAVLGNAVPAIVLLLVMPRIHDWAINNKIIGGILRKKLESAEKHFAGKYTSYGAAALILFVGIPLPFTGAWTGSLAAFVFNIPFRKSFPLIFAGICLAATLMTIITLFADGAMNGF